jgi:DNA-directed RNA polymerase specialized sigma24 family protein
MISDLVDSRSCQPVDEACRRELVTVINESIAQLPWRMKLVVSMHVYDAIDFRTIAERLGMEKSAVEKRYQRAVSQLRENHRIRTLLGLV